MPATAPVLTGIGYAEALAHIRGEVTLDELPVVMARIQSPVRAPAAAMVAARSARHVVRDRARSAARYPQVRERDRLSTDGEQRPGAKRLGQIPPYLFAEIDRKVQEKKRAGIDVISLGIGDPDLPTPEADRQRAAGGGGRPRQPSLRVVLRPRRAARRHRQLVPAIDSGVDARPADRDPAHARLEGRHQPRAARARRPRRRRARARPGLHRVRHRRA